MKTLKPHPHVIRLLGCVTETGKIFKVLMNTIVHTFVELDSLPPNFLYYSLYYRKTRLAETLLASTNFPDPLFVLIEYVPYGDLLGYLRKSRGLDDTYYKDPDNKPQSRLTSEQLMKFAWQIADGMSYLSSRSVRSFLFLFLSICK